MKLSELMNGITPDPAFSGFVTSDDLVLAIDISAEQNSDVNNYAVVQTGISGIESDLKSVTKESHYIRSGPSSIKTGTQRQFRITGDLYSGDEAQDFILSHKMKFGTGQSAIVNYVYFNMLTGIGEKGQATVSVNSDGGGNAGENAEINILLSKSGNAPEKYTYSAGE